MHVHHLMNYWFDIILLHLTGPIQILLQGIMGFHQHAITRWNVD